MSSPSDRPSPFRLGTLRGFLPLNDTPITTRGQSLTGLLQSRSSHNVRDFKKRRPISVQGESDEDDADVESNAEILDFRWDGPSPTKSNAYVKSERRGSAMSDVNQMLNTPQMRSMRLIGNSNPRYQWYVKRNGRTTSMMECICRGLTLAVRQGEVLQDAGRAEADEEAHVSSPCPTTFEIR